MALVLRRVAAALGCTPHHIRVLSQLGFGPCYSSIVGSDSSGNTHQLFVIMSMRVLALLSYLPFYVHICSVLQDFQSWPNGGGCFHKSASIDPTAFVEIGAVVHSKAVVGEHVCIGSGAVIGPGVSVGQSTKIG